MTRQRIVYLGSGAFGLPTLKVLHDRHNITLVVTQPDRPAGRKRVMTPTPIGAFAAEHNLLTIKPENVNDAGIVKQIHDMNPDAIVVIAYGQKLGEPLLDKQFALNLHSSLLPKFRGAAPINRAMMAGETKTGVTVITLAQRMDAGMILAQASTSIDPKETAGELHDRLAQLGPDVVLRTLQQHADDALQPRPQDESQATRAPKLRKDEGTVWFNQPADRVRAIVHGLTPWPGCTVELVGERLKILRVKVVEGDCIDLDSRLRGNDEMGVVFDDGMVTCESSAVRLVEVQPSGKRPMSFEDYANGRDLPFPVKVCTL